VEKSQSTNASQSKGGLFFDQILLISEVRTQLSCPVKVGQKGEKISKLLTL
jgi:hypothetical protein